MDEYFKNKYRASTTRLSHWNYAWPSMYYVTICTIDRICCLGDIRDGNVYLSEIGKIVFDEWLKTQTLRPYIELDDFIIMPNHLHGIIVIKDNDLGDLNRRDTARHVSTVRKFGYSQPKSLSSIIGSFKSAVSKKCHENNLDFYWQTNYYEHIIKNDEDYARIKEYIALNPINWEFSKNNPKNFNK